MPRRRRERQSAGLGRSVVATLEAVLAERAEEAVLVEAVARRVAGLEPGDVVGDAVPAPLLELAHVALEALHDERALVHPVAPVLLEAVTGADGEVHVGQRRHLHVEADAGRVRERQHRRRHHARAGDERVLELGTAQPFGLAGRVGPDAHRLLGGALAVVLLVEDVQQRELGELHRRVVPHSSQLPLALADAGMLGLADGTHAPRAVAGAPPPVGRDIEVLVADFERPRPEAGLGEAHRVEQHPPVLPDVLARLEERRDRALPRQVAGDAVLGGLQDHAHLLQAFDDLDVERPDARVHAVVELARGPHDPMLVAPADARERVLHAEVRGLPDTHDQHQLVAASVQVEVVAVVEVAVAGPDVADRLRDLVERVVVHRREHRASASYPSAIRPSSARNGREETTRPVTGAGAQGARGKGGSAISSTGSTISGRSSSSGPRWTSAPGVRTAATGASEFTATPSSWTSAARPVVIRSSAALVEPYKVPVEPSLMPGSNGGPFGWR